ARGVEARPPYRHPPGGGIAPALTHLAERRHLDRARRGGDRVEPGKQRGERRQPAAAAVLVAAEDAVVQLLERAFPMREHDQPVGRARRDVRRLARQRDRLAIAAEGIDEAVRLGLLARPYPPLGERLDRAGVEVAAGGDMRLEPGIGGVEQRIEPALLL